MILNCEVTGCQVIFGQVTHKDAKAQLLSSDLTLQLFVSNLTYSAKIVQFPLRPAGTPMAIHHDRVPFSGVGGGEGVLAIRFSRFDHFLEHCVFGWHYFGDLQCLRRICSKIMTFMPFERLFDGIRGGSN